MRKLFKLKLKLILHMDERQKHKGKYLFSIICIHSIQLKKLYLSWGAIKCGYAHMALD